MALYKTTCLLVDQHCLVSEIKTSSYNEVPQQQRSIKVEYKTTFNMFTF